MSQRSKVIHLYKTLDRFEFKLLPEVPTSNLMLLSCCLVSLTPRWRPYLWEKFLNLSKDWPQGQDVFKKRLHGAFSKNKAENDPEKIEKLLKHGEFVVKEIEALYMLKKYRTLKRRYYREET